MTEKNRIEPEDPDATLCFRNTVTLTHKLTDDDLDVSIRRLGLVDEYLDVFEDRTQKLAITVLDAIRLSADKARHLAREFIAVNIVIYPGSKEVMRKSFRTLGFFKDEKQTRKSHVTRLCWDMRQKYKV